MKRIITMAAIIRIDLSELFDLVTLLDFFGFPGFIL